MSVGQRSRFRSVPAWQFTWTQRAKPLGRVGRPTLLTPERRQMVEAAAEAARRGERVMVASLARRLGVSRRSAKRYLCMVASEQGAQHAEQLPPPELSFEGIRPPEDPR